MIKILNSEKTAIVFGVTEPVGRKLLEQLVLTTNYTKVKIFVLKKIKVESPKVEQIIFNPGKQENWEKLVSGDDIFLCLNKNITNENSANSSFELNFQAAKCAAINKVNQLFLVSSALSDKDSFFKTAKLKGSVESAIIKLPFWAIHIFKPSVILEERNENQFGSTISSKIAALFNAVSGNLISKFQPIEADIVAKSMLIEAQGIKKGVHIHKNESILKLAEKTDRYLT